MSVISKFEGEVLTITEAALAMRCSKTHMQNVLQGRVANVPRLPCISRRTSGVDSTGIVRTVGEGR